MDALTLQAIKDIDPKKFFEGNTLPDRMEMCGFVLMTTALIYAKLRGIKNVEVFKDMLIRGTRPVIKPRW